MEEKIEKKTKLTAGADERTPSRSQYFSWINNTNEGSTEKQTLINLAYFGYLHDKYGMDLDIYAWDAGNLDGAGGTYEGADSAKNRAQYPHGYGPIAEAAKKIGTRLGVWCGPDGFGDTPEEAAARHELMVSLCRDFHFAEFKIDGVCGQLRPEKRENFVRMMKECRKYSPDLVLLNHRLELGIGNPYATTFLWNGQETYVDVFVGSTITAPHNRAYLFFRGNVPGLQRLSEDHGVCISSCVDYFEDDLIYQAFGRCLILAPEIYGNPWLMRDDEQAHLARIYNLHRTYRDILVDGLVLPEELYGPSSVSRGNGKTQFITTGNPSWSRGKITLNLNREIGLERCGKVMVSTHHPYEKLVGIFDYGDRVDIELPAFRACLIEVSAVECARPMLTGCEYEVLHEERGGKIDRVKVIRKFGDVKLTDGVTEIDAPAELVGAAEFDNTIAEPIVLGHAEECDVPENAEQLFETATFAMNMDSLESRELARSGETAIPEVKAARDAFFGQKTYLLRGCESRFAFDGNDDTFFDGISRIFFDGFRMDGGCLRVDFGREYDADFVMIEYFDIDKDEAFDIRENEKFFLKRQVLTGKGDVSSDLAEWRDVVIEDLRTVRHETVDVLIHSIHNIVQRTGTRRQVFYGAGKGVRYFRLPRPIDHIYKIALIKDGRELELVNPHVNNLLPSYRDRKPVNAAQIATVTVTEENFREDCYIAVAMNGEYGRECAYAVAEIDGELVAFPRRAPSYASNVWECWAVFASTSWRNYTYYLPVSRDMIGKEIKIHTIFNGDKKNEVSTDIYLCDANNEKHGITVEL